MDLFWLDKSILKFFSDFSFYKLFILSLTGMIGTYLYCGTFSTKKGSKK